MVLIVGLHWEKPQSLRRIARAATTASAVMSAYVLIQSTGTDWLPWAIYRAGRLGVKPIGTMGNSNFAGGYLGMCLPLFLYMTLTTTRLISRRILQALLVVDLLALWLTQARGGLVAAALGLATVGILYRDRFPRWTKTSVVVVGILGGLVVALAVWHPQAKPIPSVLSRPAILSSHNLTDRVRYWAAAWKIFLHHPVTGTGPDTYYMQYPLNRLPADAAQLGLTVTDKPHNIYFEYAANSGILGLFSYLGLVGLAIRYAFVRSKVIPEPERFLLVSFLGFLIAYLTQGFFSIDLPPLAAMGWVAIGGVAVLADPLITAAREKLEGQKRKSPNWKKAKTNKRMTEAELANRYHSVGGVPPAVHTISFVLVLGVLALGLRPLRADVKIKTAQDSLAKGRLELALSQAKSAIRLNPLDPVYRRVTGDILIRQARSAQDPQQRENRYRQAAKLFESSLKAQPGDPLGYVSSANMLSEWAAFDPRRFSQADAEWRALIAHDPVDWEPHSRYAKFLVSWADTKADTRARERAVRELLIVAAKRPPATDTWIRLGRAYLSLGDLDRARGALQTAQRIGPGNQEVRDLMAELDQHS